MTRSLKDGRSWNAVSIPGTKDQVRHTKGKAVRKRLEVPDGDVADTTDKDPQFITALARGLDVLKAFRAKDGPLGNQQIAERTNLPKPTVSRVTYTLSKLGYLNYLPDAGKYQLGVGVLSLGFTCLGSIGLRDVARPMMQEMADWSGVAVALGTRDRLSMVYVECCRGDSAITLNLDVGSHIKLGTSAMGRAYIAAMPEHERTNLLEQLEAHEGARWPQVRDGIQEAIEDYQTRGFTLSTGDWKSEVNAVGVPICLGDGSLSFALNCGGPAYKMSRERLINEIGPRAARLAEDIRRSMGVT